MAPVPPHAVDSDMDLDALAREELSRLQRQYRLMESDRKAYTEEAGTKGQREQRMLQFLEIEKENLLTDLTNALSLRNQDIDKHSIQTIIEILDRLAEHNLEIEYQLGQIAEMEEQVSKITHRVVQQKLKVQALFGHSITVAQADRRLRVLEDRLYHYTTLFDTQVSKNRATRDEINLNLMERGRFHSRFEFLKQKLGLLKRHMAEIVDVATSTYDQRDEDAAKITSYRERNDKESKQHVLEMKEFQRVLHHDEKGHSFMVVKARRRPLLEEDVVRQRRLDRQKERNLDDLLLSYKNSFRELLTVANTRDIETLVQTYMAQEQRNFARFSYISDLNHEVDFILQGISSLKEEIDQKAADQKTERNAQRELLRELDDQFREKQEKHKQCSEQLLHTEMKMEVIVSSIQETFIQAECGNSPIIQLLGNRGGIQPRNAALCLNVLEHRISELLYDKGILEIRKFVELEDGQLPSKVGQQVWQGGVKPKPSGGPFRPKVMITGRMDPTGEGDDDDDDKTDKNIHRKPLTYEQLTQMLQGRLAEHVTPAPSNVDIEASHASLFNRT